VPIAVGAKGGFKSPAALAAASVDAVAAVLRSERAYETPSVGAGQWVGGGCVCCTVDRAPRAPR
jgi:hypothetical protein